jgi:aldehyde dehydrogenase (NAD+)
VIVCPDVENIEKVAKEVALSTWFISGQACIATKRIYVHADIHERFLESFLAATRKTVVGSCADPDAYIGPIQNVDLFRRLKRLEQECETNGYNIVLDGRNRDSVRNLQVVNGNGETNGWSHERPEKGFFFYPTLVLDPPPDCRLVTQEQFGPIAPYRRWTDFENVIKEVNSSEYGLGATVYCKSDEKAVEIGKRIHAGMLWANCHPRAMGPEPYGGTKQSGFGAEGGEAGLKCFMNPQTMFRFRWSMVKD